MKNNQRILYSLLTTIAIFIISSTVGSFLKLPEGFIPQTFITHTSILILSLLAIYLMRERMVYRIALPKFRSIFRPILFGLLANILVNIPLTILIKLLGGEIESLSVLKEFSPLQLLLFVAVYAAIAEELLFRGFLLNFLKPLRNKGISVLNRRLSLPVIISAIMFGLAHIVIISAGADVVLVFRTVIFTFVLGLVAGYYQEKYDNNAYPIIVHMSANSLAVLASLGMSH